MINISHRKRAQPKVIELTSVCLLRVLLFFFVFLPSHIDGQPHLVPLHDSSGYDTFRGTQELRTNEDVSATAVLPLVHLPFIFTVHLNFRLGMVEYKRNGDIPGS